MKPKLFIIMLALLLVVLLPFSACAQKDDISDDGDGEEYAGCEMPILNCKTVDDLIYAIRQARMDVQYYDVGYVIRERAAFDRVYVPNMEIDGFKLYMIELDESPRLSYCYFPETTNFDDPLLIDWHDAIVICYYVGELEDIAAIMEKHASQYKTQINEDGFIYAPEYRTIIKQIGDTFMSVDIGKNLPESFTEYEFMKSLCEFKVVEID